LGIGAVASGGEKRAAVGDGSGGVELCGVAIRRCVDSGVCDGIREEAAQ
jgi:hypothetical protein